MSFSRMLPAMITPNKTMIFNLTDIPKSKRYVDDMTPEQHVIMKCINREKLTKEDESVLQESIDFYKNTFPKLKEVNLEVITKEEVLELKEYLDKIFNFNITISNDIHFEILFRVSFVRPEFTEKGKVRNPDFLKYPPIDVVKKKGVYNRANTDNKTVFYGSFYENVAIRETKPDVGDRIIISTWKNISGKPFNSYPITNSEIDNEGVQKSTQAFKETKEANNPLFGEIMDLTLAFLASEFVKDSEIKSEKRFEYLYSAYFADKILTPFIEGDPTPNLDFIIYPSVAWKHEHENVAITPNAVENKLKLIKLIEYDVVETYYDSILEKDEMPVKLKYIREADWIEKDLIIWEDE